MRQLITKDKMIKKLFAFLIIVAVVTACNNNSEATKTTNTDSVSSTESPLMDAVNTADSANKILYDSSHHMMDTSHKK